MDARLVLEDGSVFKGRSFSGLDHASTPCTGFGEVVFNTAMTGYQEALTDPSYRGQILVMTATQIGNYGVNSVDVESATPQVAGFVVREASRLDSNYRSESMLGPWLAGYGIPVLSDIDTRALVRRLRVKGVMRGVMTTDASLTNEQLLEQVRNSPTMSGRNLASEASSGTAGHWSEGLVRIPPSPEPQDRVGSRTMRVVAIDCGAKQNIYRHLVERGCEVQILPWDSTAEQIRALKPDGLFVSNGPGDPAAVEPLIKTLQEVAGEVPTFGICLGHQLLALALGATTWKLPFGHRGANQPVRNLETGQVEITSQNHGFCVDGASLEAHDCLVTHVHLNDRTVAGFRHVTKPIFAVQYHPEASPGPHDAAYLFDQFVTLMGGDHGVGSIPGDLPQASSTIEA
jgi:carbamoyl-phosphate synthase small subunit